MLLNKKFYEGIQSCFECANYCWISADASLHEEHSADLMPCMSLCLKTAEVCAQTARLLIEENIEALREQLRICAEVCEATWAECQRHADNQEHCLICARCCEECANICRSYLETIETVELAALA